MTRGDELPSHFNAVRWAGTGCGRRPGQEACFGLELARRVWIEGPIGASVRQRFRAQAEDPLQVWEDHAKIGKQQLRNHWNA